MRLNKFRIFNFIKEMLANREIQKKEDKQVEVARIVVKKQKSGVERKMDMLKAIYLHTKKFRVKKKLDKRIIKLENEKLLQVREM